MVEAQVVEYCPVSTCPPEFCEFLPKAEFEKCLPWLVENRSKEWLRANCSNYAEFFVDEPSEEVAEKLASLSVKVNEGPKEGDIVKKLPGGKVKKKEKPEVTVERAVRNKRKCVTTVKGLETFGIKLNDAAKKFGKKFACGSSVVKGPTEKEQIDIQGDFQDEMAQLILDTWKDIKAEDIYYVEGNKKSPCGL
mmetsp:Transcript_2627/g.2930  ORF Transcript_2627/g.2930 Transcript_2627/m.2930 type:complete len:193 (+) Transcript_2627:183-761(+)|eukprot:CAMPEP_0197854780 /NCGR_PEP_ID=MMETSP1438-20131217/25319_1 /TAXON_ID=1461541 /ORGANISM="Pterosperma sp., Strain CCMP1384" /LENGTH=192 /DNA_ID=CAMNT_0043469641 /DNA_START=182 /DNA_END=760 /DNA_ORIENTATION=+